MSMSRIVVGLDDTPTARAALRWAAEQARLTGATVRAVHVIDWPIGIEAYGSVELDEAGHLPEEKVSTTYRRGIHRVFEESCPEPGCSCNSPKVTLDRYWLLRLPMPICWSSGRVRILIGLPEMLPVRWRITVSAGRPARSSRCH